MREHVRQYLKCFTVTFIPLFLSTTIAKNKETRVSIMTYNVENLFDTEDDPQTHDETYLPLSKKKSPAHKKECKKSAGFGGRLWDCEFLDWNESMLDQKMKNLSEQILAAPGGKGPDILILAEIENRGVVEQLNHKYLASAGYTLTHMDSHDPRGIDQAILSRFPLFKDSYTYHTIAFQKFNRKEKKLVTKELRGILQATYDVNGKKLNVLALHLPSQAAPFAEREIVFNQLNKVAMQLPANEAVVAAGDFNITSKEWEKQNVSSNFIEPIWQLADKLCKECKGTYYYAPKKEWSYFDLLLLRNDREKKSRWHWDGKTAKVISAKGLDHPVRFDPNSKQGASDHFPFYSELVLE